MGTIWIIFDISVIGFFPFWGKFIISLSFLVCHKIVINLNVCHSIYQFFQDLQWKSKSNLFYLLL